MGTATCLAAACPASRDRCLGWASVRELWDNLGKGHGNPWELQGTRGGSRAPHEPAWQLRGSGHGQRRRQTRNRHRLGAADARFSGGKSILLKDSSSLYTRFKIIYSRIRETVP